MKRNLLFFIFLLGTAVAWSQNDFAHGFSFAGGETDAPGNGSVSYTFGMPFSSQTSNTDGFSLSEGVMHAQLIRLDMVLEGCQNDSLAVSPAHVKDTSGFFSGYEGTAMTFDGKSIIVFPAGTYDSTGSGAHYSHNSQFNYDSITTLLLKVYPIYELFDTLYLDSTEIVTDYASNELHIPAYQWHQLHGGPNEYRLVTAGSGCDSIRHFFVNLCGGVVKDHDGNEYASVFVGNAPKRYCWTKQNLKTTTYSSGGDAPNMIYKAVGHSDEAANLATYGRLYDWYAAVNVPAGSTDEPTTTANGGFVTGICPPGWHVPDSNNILSLTDIDAFDLMADILWLTPGTDSGSGFYALPAGHYSYNNNRFENMLGETYFWSSVKHSLSVSWVCSLQTGCNRVTTDDITCESGVSVRCVKNQRYDNDGNELND